AALLVALSPLLIAKSQVIEVDAPLTLLVALGLLASVNLARGLTWRRAIIAGALAGLAATTKYPGAVLVWPRLVSTALVAGADRHSPRRPRRGEAVTWPQAVLAGGAAFLAVAFITSPFLFLDHRAALADLAVEREHMRLGHFGSDLGPAWISYARDWVTV